MTITSCRCGRLEVSHSDGITFSWLTCDKCKDFLHKRWLATQPWFVKLDEWQHARHPDGKGWTKPLFYLWLWAWRPICDKTERYHCGDYMPAPGAVPMRRKPRQP